MKYLELIRYLTAVGCELLREGGRLFMAANPELNKRSAIPRHAEIKDILANKISKDLGVKPIRPRLVYQIKRISPVVTHAVNH